MFPLGSVLLPGGGLPLHVFEPRYQALVRHCIEAPGHEFGVVLIDRGSEVGGGESRRDVGVVARMVKIAPLDGGRFAVLAVGTRRIRVVEWLPDDPYPRAVVEDWPCDDGDTEVFTAAEQVPLGPADRYDVLCAPTTEDRRRVLAQAIADVEAAVRFQRGE